MSVFVAADEKWRMNVCLLSLNASLLHVCNAYKLLYALPVILGIFESGNDIGVNWDLPT